MSDPTAAIPDFTPAGILPVGTYPVTLADLYASVLVKGPQHAAIWDEAWRRHLVDNAKILISQLRQIGITEIFLDGSFTEAKPHPNDVDGYFECDPVDLARGNIERSLNALDPYKIWTWDPAQRRPARGSTKRQLPMWHRYRVEFWPHCSIVMSGILDPFGNQLQFPAAFRQQRDTGARKGIVQVVD